MRRFEVWTGGPGAAVLLLVIGAGCTSASGEAAPHPRPGEDAIPERAGPVQPPRPPEGRAWVVFGVDTILAEVARTAGERRRGLMGRTGLDEDAGMLFVFDEPAVHSFWMSDTYIPLDVAFIDADFRVLEIQRMEPETTDLHESPSPALMALEVNAGWFQAHGVNRGDRARVIFGAR